MPPSRRTLSSLNLAVLGAVDGGRCYEVSVQGNRLYGGFSEILQSFDISDRSNVHKLCSLPLPDVVNGINIVGQIAYVSTATAGLHVIDITNPADLRVIDHIASMGRSREVVVHASNLYLSDDSGGVGIFSLTDPAHPVEAARWPSTSARHVSFDGTRAFVSDGPGGVIVLDVSDPAVPALLGAYNTPGETSATAPFGQYLCVADGGGGLRILDVADPAAIVQAGVSAYIGSAWDVAMNGSYACVATDYRGAAVVSLASPSSPVVVSSPEVHFGAFGHDIDIVGNELFLAHNYTGMSIIDIVLPNEAPATGSFDPQGNTYDVVVQDNLAYLAVDSSGLRILDVSDPTNPIEIGFYDTPVSAHGVYVTNGRAYVCGGTGGLHIIDVTNPQVPVLLGTYARTAYPALDARGVEVQGNTAYVAGGASGLNVINVTNPAAPTLLGRNGMVYGYSFASEVDVVGNYAYLAEGAAGLAIIDITNPQSMPLTEYNFQTYGVTIAGDIAYLSCGGNGLYVLDISIPTQPVQIGYYTQPYYSSWGPLNTVVVGTRAYIAQGYLGFNVVDVTDPTDPFRIWYYDTPGEPMDVAVAGSHAFIADQAGGLQIVGIDGIAAMEESGSYDSDGLLHGVEVTGVHAFTLGDAGMSVVEVANPRRTQEIVQPYAGDTDRLHISDALAFLTAWFRVLTYDITDPEQPVEVSRFLSRRRISDPWGEDSLWAYSKPNDTALIGNYLLVAFHGDSLTTRDFSDPSNPVQVGNYPTSLPLYQMAVADQHTCIACGSYGLVIFDASDPTQIDSIAAVETSGDARVVDVWGGHAFVGNMGGGVHIIDIANPAAPEDVSVFPTSGYVYDITAYNNFLYVVDEAYGLRVLDVLQPESPIEVGFYTSRAPRGITAYGDRLFYSDYEMGTLILGNLLPPTEARSPEPGLWMGQNFPNPFNPQTTILLSVPRATRARLVVYDVGGRRVRTLLNGNIPRGSHRLVWNGHNDRGQAVASGVYFYRLEAGSQSISRKMVLLR